MAILPKDPPDGDANAGQSESGAEPYPYIYVNADGSARELHREEREYLSSRISRFGEPRRYVKSTYSQKDGWGQLEGVLKRSSLPREIEIGAAPRENPKKLGTFAEVLESLRAKASEATINSNRADPARQLKRAK
ncbi:MAG TPA: hypothetical protein VGR47_18865 [Terracidiphilus sp.]|nr:hypothetical protein [Terracidiphilus sp.]